MNHPTPTLEEAAAEVKITQERATELVRTLAIEVWNLIGERTKGIDPKNRWLIYGRVLNSLFSKFYKVAIIDSAAAVERASLAPKGTL